MPSGIVRSIRNNIVVGLILVTPIAVTAFIVVWLFEFTTNGILAFVPGSVLKQYPELLFRIAALAIVLVTLFLIGLLVRNLLGRKLYQIGDAILSRTPVINKIYISVRQISEALLAQSQALFKEVVVIEYPRKGIYALGFTTGHVPPDVLQDVPALEGTKDLVAVFVATAPNPTSGFFVFVPRRDVHRLPLSVSDAMRLVVSAGAVFPGSAPLDGRPTLLDKLEAWLAKEGRADTKPALTEKTTARESRE